MQLCVQVRACVQLLCRHWSVCVLRLDLLSQTRVQCVECVVTLHARAFNPIMARSAPQHAFARVHTTHAGSLSTHTDPIHPLTLSRALSLTHHSLATQALSVASAHQTPQCVSSISADLACAISLRAEICDDSLIRHSRPSVLNQAPSTEGEPGGTNRSPPATAVLAWSGRPCARALHRPSHSRRGPLFMT
jgi:hypothetical protein